MTCHPESVHQRGLRPGLRKPCCRSAKPALLASSSPEVTLDTDGRIQAGSRRSGWSRQQAASPKRQQATAFQGFAGGGLSSNRLLIAEVVELRTTPLPSTIKNQPSMVLRSSIESLSTVFCLRYFREASCPQGFSSSHVRATRISASWRVAIQPFISPGFSAAHIRKAQKVRSIMSLSLP